MSKEREQHPCLSKEKLELAHKLLRKEVKPRFKIDKNLQNLCQSCTARPFTKKFKTKDKLTLYLCDKCFEKYQTL